MNPDREPDLPLPPKAKVRRYLFFLIVLGLSLYILLPQFAPIEHAFRVAATLKMPFVAISLATQILSYLGSGYLLRAVVRTSDPPVSVVEGALVTAGANSMGTLGGGVLGTAGMTYLWLRRRGVSSGVAGLGGWIPIFLNEATLAIISLVGLLTLLLLHKFSSILVLALGLALLILGSGLFALIWCLTHREKMVPLALTIAHFLGKVRRKAIDARAAEITAGRLLHAWDSLLAAGWRRPVTGALLNIGFDILTLNFLFLSSGRGVSPMVLVAGYGVPQLVGKLTVVMGGAGVVETTMVGLYAALGVPTAIAFIVVLVYRLFSFWMPTLAGIALVPYLEHGKCG